MLTKFRPEIEAHMIAGHFTIYPKPWMNQRRIWVWTKGATELIGGAFATQREAEDAAVAWFEGQS